MRLVFLCITLIVVISVFAFSMTLNGFSYYKDIITISNQVGVETSLVQAICRVESSFKKDAVSPKGAIGLMQLMPDTAKWICENNKINYQKNMVFEPNFNIFIGCLYLKELLSKYPLEWAICAYNAGQGKVDQWISNGLLPSDVPYKETSNYLKKVLHYKKIYDMFI